MFVLNLFTNEPFALELGAVVALVADDCSSCAVVSVA